MDQNDIEILPKSQRPIKRCFKCSSIYVTDLECESCGLQFKRHDLGRPLGPQSFFALKEEFEVHKNQNKKEYRKCLILRFRALLEALEHSFDNLDNWNTFNFELLELTRHLKSCSENKYLLNKVLLEKRDHPQFFELNRIIHNHDSNIIDEIEPYPFKRTVYFLCTLLLLVPILFFLNNFYLNL